MKGTEEPVSAESTLPQIERARFRNLIEQSDAGFLLLDLDFRISYANTQVLSILGYQTEEFVGQLLFHFVPYDDLTQLRMLKQESLRERQLCFSINQNLVKKDSQLYPARLHLALIRSEDGAPRHYRLLVRDRNHTHLPTESHDAQRLRHVLKHLPVFLTTADKNGYITRAEGKGYESALETMVGLHYTEVYKDLPDSRHRIERVLSGESFSEEVRYENFWFEIHYAPLFDENEELDGATWLAFEIGHKKEKEKMQSRLLAKEQAERQAAQAAIKEREEHLLRSES